MYTVSNVIARNQNQWRSIPNTGNAWQIQSLMTMDSVYVDLIDARDASITSQYELLTEVPQLRQNVNQTIDALFASVPAGSYPPRSTPKKALSQIHSIRYSDLFDFGYCPERGLASVTPNPRDDVNVPDLLIRNGGRNPNEPHIHRNNLLYVVNGLIMAPTMIGTSVYVKRGHDLLRRNPRVQQMGVIDCGDWGVCTLEPLTTSNVQATAFRKTDTETTMIVDTTHGTRTDHTTLAVIHGRLHFDVHPLDGDRMAICIDHERALVNGMLDDVSVGDWATEMSPGHRTYAMNSVKGLEYLTTGTSFLLHIPTGDMCLRVEDLGRTDTAGVYEHYRIPSGVLLLEDGMVGCYRVSSHDEYNVEILSTQPNSNWQAHDTGAGGSRGITLVGGTGKSGTIGRGIMYDWYSLK